MLLNIIEQHTAKGVDFLTATDQISALPSSLKLIGTADQVLLNTVGSELVVSLPQSIATGSSPVFAGLDLSGGLLTNLGSPSVSGDAANKGYVDGVVQGLKWQESVLDKDLSTPPISPNEGDRYLVAAGASGDWAGKDDNLAEYEGSVWSFKAPEEGLAVWVEDEDKLYVYGDSGWVTFGSTSDHGNLIGLTDDDHTQYMHKDIARTVTAQHSFSPGSAQAPFLLGTNAQGELVAGLNADQWDGYEFSDYLDQAVRVDDRVVFKDVSLPQFHALNLAGLDANSVTNYILYSESIVANWISNNDVTGSSDDAAIGPNGLQDMSLLRDNDASNFARFEKILSGVASDNEQWVFSFICVKEAASTYPIIDLQFTGASAVKGRVIFNSETGAITEQGSTDKTKVELLETPYGDFWRVSLAATNDSSGNTSVRVRLYPAASDDMASSDAPLVGEVYMGYVQLEKDKAEPSPYVRADAGVEVTDTVNGIHLGMTQDEAGTRVPVFTLEDESLLRLNQSLLTSDDVQFNSMRIAGEWDDISVSLTSVKPGAVNPPEYLQFKDDGAGSVGVFAWHFDDAVDEEVFFDIQLPHAYKEGTDLKFHVHWAPTTADAGDVVWGVEYAVQNIDGTFGNTSIAYATVSTDATAHKHHADAVVTIDGSSLTVSAILLCRVFRAATHSADTYAADVALLSADFHLYKDSIGSDSEFSKV